MLIEDRILSLAKYAEVSVTHFLLGSWVGLNCLVAQTWQGHYSVVVRMSLSGDERFRHHAFAKNFVVSVRVIVGSSAEKDATN